MSIKKLLNAFFLLVIIFIVLLAVVIVLSIPFLLIAANLFIFDQLDLITIHVIGAFAFFKMSLKITLVSFLFSLLVDVMILLWKRQPWGYLFQTHETKSEKIFMYIMNTLLFSLTIWFINEITVSWLGAVGVGFSLASIYMIMYYVVDLFKDDEDDEEDDTMTITIEEDINFKINGTKSSLTQLNEAIEEAIEDYSGEVTFKTKNGETFSIKIYLEEK
ncbi:hypothetical protein LC087_17160 [Bacillus carboniphilus]|uniref:Uncharacterized protein n=1 Tax=Bacillus carboniphilus TaxID=86663 RepID=A0ABY9JXR3_9BACI|nr:hypothetical protein [Bacillus carboniphilus]WLR42410.1 hypothetical protein LC087_17160 [Bacillus carboniphilus]